MPDRRHVRTYHFISNINLHLQGLLFKHTTWQSSCRVYLLNSLNIILDFFSQLHVNILDWFAELMYITNDLVQ